MAVYIAAQSFIENNKVIVNNLKILFFNVTNKNNPKKIIKSKLSLSNNNSVEGLKIDKKYKILDLKLFNLK
tara:strand:+ start:131 stop:343 length:213 start_codon:yes stop_codon:yes gene_type:complete